jgi:hypothetical protein
MLARLLGVTLLVACAHPQKVTMEDKDRKLFEVRHISVSIDRPPGDVYEFASNPENLPRWATGLAGTVKQIGDEWIAQAPMGKVRIRFSRRNDLGVMDHDVTLESGVTIHNPMRVLPNSGGSEIVFSLFHQPGVPDAKFNDDAKRVTDDLLALKQVLER